MIKDIILNIPNLYRPAMITATATLTGAFLGAIIAQYFSHKMSIRRDNQKYYKECYQNLYAPILFEVYAYIDTCTHFRKDHDIRDNVNVEEMYKKIINHIESNLMHATPKLIADYHSVKENEYKDDFSGFIYRIKELTILETYLNELQRISKRSNIFDKNSTRKIIVNIVYLRVWIILIDYYAEDVDAAVKALSYKFYYAGSKINYRTYKKLKNYNKNKMDSYVNTIINNLQNSRKSMFKAFGDWAEVKYSAIDKTRKESKRLEVLYKLLTWKKSDIAELIRVTEGSKEEPGVD